MSTDQLKNSIVDKIFSIDDEEFLQALNTILESKSEKDKIYKVSESQYDEIKKGMDQLDNNEFIANEELEKEEAKTT